MNDKTSLAQSIALREGGLPHGDGEYYHADIFSRDSLTGPIKLTDCFHKSQIDSFRKQGYTVDVIARAFTVGELIDWMPDEIIGGRMEYTLYDPKDLSKPEWIIYPAYIEFTKTSVSWCMPSWEDSSTYKSFKSTNLITALYEAALWWAKEGGGK